MMIKIGKKTFVGQIKWNPLRSKQKNLEKLCVEELDRVPQQELSIDHFKKVTNGNKRTDSKLIA